MTTGRLWEISSLVRATESWPPSARTVLHSSLKDRPPPGLPFYSKLIRFSTTTIRTKGRNLLRDPRASLHVSGRDFFNFAVVTGTISLAVAHESDDDAVEKLFEIHSGLGAASERDGFGMDMLAHLDRMAVDCPHVKRIYGQILDRLGAPAWSDHRKDPSAMSKDDEIDQLRRGVRYLMDRSTILHCISVHSRGHDRHSASQHQRPVLWAACQTTSLGVLSRQAWRGLQLSKVWF